MFDSTLTWSCGPGWRIFPSLLLNPGAPATGHPPPLIWRPWLCHCHHRYCHRYCHHRQSCLLPPSCVWRGAHMPLPGRRVQKGLLHSWSMSRWSSARSTGSPVYAGALDDSKANYGITCNHAPTGHPDRCHIALTSVLCEP